jgi:hypothetical protein
MIIDAREIIIGTDLGERYYQLMHPISQSIITIQTKTIHDIICGKFDIDSITKESLFELVQVMSTVLLEFDDEI